MSTLPYAAFAYAAHADLQAPRVRNTATALAERAKLDIEFSDDDVEVYDSTLAPGYGKLNPQTVGAIKQSAQLEGLMLDPVYTGKVMAAMVKLADENKLKGENILFWHTGGTPALFGYGDQLG